MCLQSFLVLSCLTGVSLRVYSDVPVRATCPIHLTACVAAKHKSVGRIPVSCTGKRLGPSFSVVMLRLYSAWKMNV
jgi:hypothetical protein